MSGDQRDPGPPEAPPRALSFGGVAEAYERGRPHYPREAAAWLTSNHPCAVLELGAGTGKLTRELLALGHDVHATDPDEAMLEVLRREAPGARATLGTAEDIPAPDRSFDVVVAAQAFHWFDLDEALPEIARVLRPGGRLSLVWNERDQRIPWVRRLGAILAGPEQAADQVSDQLSEQADKHARDQLRDPTEVLAGSGIFGTVDTSSHRFWQVVERESIQDLALSRSDVAGLGEAERAAKLGEVLAFYDDYGRGMDGMQLPYHAQCFRTTVQQVPRPRVRAGEETSTDRGPSDDAVHDTMPRGLRAKHRAGEPTHDAPADEDDEDDDQMLLIDFR